MFSPQEIEALNHASTTFIAKEISVDDIEPLRKVLRYHDWRYYVLSEPIITDFAYDTLFKKLVAIESEYPALVSPDSPTQRVASGLSENFESVQHLASMLSLDNSYNAGDVTDFDRKVRDLTRATEIAYCVEPKFDGASIALVYENDQLVRAATRGDGIMGEDITNNARAINSIPLSAQFSKYGISKIELRGEVIISKQTFQNINEARAAAGEKTFQNARNTASGSLRMKDPREVAARGLEAILYHVSYATDAAGNNLLGSTLLSHFNNIKMLYDCGFKTPLNDLKVCSGPQQVSAFIQLWDEKRHHFPIETDGMVVKVNLLQQQQQCGSTSHHPRWAIAYKFAAKQAQSTLLNVEFQVGRTGAVTPVAKIAPVALAGVTITSISLHNEDFIREKDIRLNDTVIVERAGEVIPYIVGVVEALRKGDEKTIEFPRNCPSCHEVLVKPEDEVVWRCDNAECSAQIEERTIHFVSKDCMDIDGLGRSIVIDFIQRRFIQSIEDIYCLPYHEIQQLEGWGEKSITNLRDGIESSKKRPLWRLLNALGIRHVGVSTSKDIAAHIQHLLQLADWNVEQLTSIEGIGPKVAKTINEFFKHDGNIHLIKQLEAAGLNLANRAEDSISKNNKLGGKTFLFTGSLQHFNRDRAKELVEENGGKLLSSVSANLNFLVVGEDAGSKLAKAKKIPSITVLSEEEFLQLLE
jgi:DNA ligase (NAD+)